MKPLPDLPPAVWVRVAMHAGSVQDWAMASGCCRAMWTAPLEAVYLEDPRAVPWVAKRWHSTHMLHLDITAEMEKALSKALLQSSLGSLDELHLVCPEEDRGCHVVTAWLLKEASRRLRALRIVSELGTCMALPKLSRLEHLMLEQRCVDQFGPLCEALPQLQQLQTLHLRGQFPYSVSADSLKLQLSSLQRLHKASLVNYVPACLQLPVACDLQVKLSDCDSAYDPVWTDVAASITSFEWSFDTSVEESLEELPSFIRAACRLRRLRISAGDVGTNEKPLSLAPAAHVDWLWIASGDRNLVEVPRHQAWGFFGIVATGRMGVCFEDVTAFASQLPEFFLGFGSMEGLDILDLAEMIMFAGSTADRSRVAFCSTHDNSQGGDRHVISYPSRKPPRLVELEGGFCTCGTCRRCLLDARRINRLL